MNVQSVAEMISAANGIQRTSAQNAGGVNFGDVFKEALDQTNFTDANDKVSNLAWLAGEAETLHDVTIAGEKANIALSLTIEIRDKLVEAYNEIMRMQV